MRKEWICKGMAMGVSMMLLTGCGSQMPNLTETDMQAVGEYAAGLLLKYDANHRSRLVELEEESMPQEESAEVPEIPETPEEAEKQEPQMETGAADTPVIDMASQMTLEEQLGLPDGVVINFQGEEVTDTYPSQGGEDIYFALDAAPGKKLLVLKFNLANGSQTDVTVDVLSQKQRFLITANESTRNALATMLLEDLTQYSGTIPAGGNEEVVLITEVDETVAENISSLSLTVKNETTTSVTVLR